MTAASGYSVAHDTDKCIECMECERACNFGSIQFISRPGILHYQRVYNKMTCMGCELCVEVCPQNSLSLYRDSTKPLPLDLEILNSVIAIEEREVR